MGALAIAEKAIDTLKGNVQQGMEDRGKNATGGTSRRLATIPSGNDVTGAASLEADGNWRYVGNGRGPGGRPPIGSIRAWIAARGLTLNAYAVANRIAREGSRDFRLKRTNVFLDEIEAWEAKDVPLAEDEFARDVERRALEVFDSVTFN